MSKTVFLSCVSCEFGALRQRLANFGQRTKKCHIRHQDDFVNRGVKTLQMLDEEVQQSDFVVHLVGAQAGWCVPKDQAELFLQNHPEFSVLFPGLVEQALEGQLPATQWEAWLGLYHDKRLLAFQLLCETEDPLQSRHLKRLTVREQYPATAANTDVLYDEIISSLIGLGIFSNADIDPQATGAQPTGGDDAAVPRERKPAPLPPEGLIELISAGRIVPVIGSGISAAAHSTDAAALQMPTYRELIERLLKGAVGLKGNDHDQRDIEKVQQALNDDNPDEAARLLYKDILGNNFFHELRRIINPIDGKLQPSLSHTLLRILDFDLVITTNYDRLLERFVTPNHEVITPLDVDALEYFVGNLNYNNSNQLLIKLHGDISRPETLLFGRDRLDQFYQGMGVSGREKKATRSAAMVLSAQHGQRMDESLSRLFHDRSFLFLGLSFLLESEGYVSVLEDYLEDSIHPHYALVPKSEAGKEWKRDLARKLNITFIEYEPDKHHSQVPEFISYLNAGKQDKPVVGNKWAQWYLPKERNEYLQRQLQFETEARAVRFLTPTLTNGIATDAHLNEKCAPNHAGEAGVLEGMFLRRDNLLEGLHSGRLQVEILFLKEALDSDLADADDIVIDRYNSLLELIENTSLDVEVRLLPDLSQQDLDKNQATHALIYMAEPAPNVDAVVAYARQATVTEAVSVTMVEVNTDAVKDRSYQFDRYWASAWGEQRTALYIRERLEHFS